MCRLRSPVPPLVRYGTIYVFNTHMSTSNHTQGFIALITIMIISVVLLATTLTLAERGILYRFSVLDRTNKIISEQLAVACAEVATLLLANNRTYTATSSITIPVGDESCTISSITNSASVATITARSTYQGPTTNYVVTQSLQTGELLTWTEVTQP